MSSGPSLPSSSGLTSASTFSDSPTLEANLSSSEEEIGESQSQGKSILDVMLNDFFFRAILGTH